MDHVLFRFIATPFPIKSKLCYSVSFTQFVHLDFFAYSLCFQRISSTSGTCSKCCRAFSLYIRMPSRQTITNVSRDGVNIEFISSINVAGVLHSPNGNTKNSKCPSLVLKVMRGMDFGLSCIWRSGYKVSLSEHLSCTKLINDIAYSR